MSRQISVAIVGAGSRGFLLADIIARIPQWARIAAVAEPRNEPREAFVQRHRIPENARFTDWRELAERPRLCDAVVIATLDRDHAAPAIALTRLGYHMLLEKPMAPSLEDCKQIAHAQEKAGTITCVCHSLRYNEGFASLKKTVESGRIGRIATIDQLEQVAWWHQAHSFVRGNWGNEGRSTFMLLAKSCHDIDYIAYLAGAPCLRAQSFGNLSYFRSENAPHGSGERCTACSVEKTCPYSALRMYVDGARESWPANVVSTDHSRAAHLRAIESGPYGRCVWKCDNDVVDHQVVCLEFEGGITATFTMTGFTQEMGRKIRVHGTEGEISFTEAAMEVRSYADGGTERISFEKESGSHGGGDERIVASFLAAIRQNDARLVTTDARESLRTHSIVFAAEASRRQGRMMDMEEMG
jgi:predicted dehydrogenase